MSPVLTWIFLFFYFYFLDENARQEREPPKWEPVLRSTALIPMEERRSFRQTRSHLGGSCTQTGHPVPSV